MARVTVTARFQSPVERVWQVVTDLERWQWRSGLGDVKSSSDGRTFIEYEKNGFPTLFRITAFAPCRWYAFTLENANLSGTWEGFFRPLEQGGTEVEFTEDVQAENHLLRLLLGGYLRRQQKRYIEDLRRALGEEA